MAADEQPRFPSARGGSIPWPNSLPGSIILVSGMALPASLEVTEEMSGSPIGTDTGPACLSKDEDPDPDTAPRDPDFVRILHDMAPRESGS